MCDWSIVVGCTCCSELLGRIEPSVIRTALEINLKQWNIKRDVSREGTPGTTSENDEWSLCLCCFLTWWAWLLSYAPPRRSRPLPRNGCSWFAVLGCRSQPYTWDNADKRAAMKTKSSVHVHRWVTLSLSAVLKQLLIDFLSDNWSITDFSTDTTECINDFQITALLRIPLLNHHFNGNMIDREGSLHTHTHCWNLLLGIMMRTKAHP